MLCSLLVCIDILAQKWSHAVKFLYCDFFILARGVGFSLELFQNSFIRSFINATFLVRQSEKLSNLRKLYDPVGEHYKNGTHIKFSRRDSCSGEVAEGLECLGKMLS